MATHEEITNTIDVVLDAVVELMKMKMGDPPKLAGATLAESTGALLGYTVRVAWVNSVTKDIEDLRRSVHKALNEKEKERREQRAI